MDVSNKLRYDIRVYDKLQRIELPYQAATGLRKYEHHQLRRQQERSCQWKLLECELFQWKHPQCLNPGQKNKFPHFLSPGPKQLHP